MRKITLAHFLPLICIIFSGCAASQVSNNAPQPAFDHFSGRDIEVTIDDKPTLAVKEFALTDAEGVDFHKVTWKAAVFSENGRPCFTFRIKNTKYLGPLRASELMITEIRFDRPGGQWRSFKPLPDVRMTPPYSSILFKEGEKYCPKEYILTPRLRFKSLPSGDYYLALNINGINSWDRQEILLSVQ